MGVNNRSGDRPDRVFEENLEKYQVYSVTYMSGLMRELQETRQLLRMSFAGTLETLMTCVVNVDVAARCVLLDASPVPAENEMAFKSRMISFETALDKIRISFTVSRVFPDVYEGAPVFRVPFPERLVRLQRREFFRVMVPNAVMRIPLKMGSNSLNWVGGVRDLSASGVCLIDPSEALGDTVGHIYSGCTLELPDTQPLVVTLELRNSHDAEMPDGTRQRRVGFRFSRLSSAEIALIQRYITRAERQRRALLD